MKAIWICVAMASAVLGFLLPRGVVAQEMRPDGTIDYSKAPFPSYIHRSVWRPSEVVARADEAALRGQRLLADKKYAEAVLEFEKALDLLPDAPVVQDRRNEYQSLLDDSRALAAKTVVKYEVADRAIAKRQARVALADEAALRAQEQMSSGNHAGAVVEFTKALDLLPEAPAVSAKRETWLELLEHSRKVAGLQSR